MIGDKLCYPCVTREVICDELRTTVHNGITFKERLIIALASNPEMYLIDGKSIESGDAAKIIVESADAILREMEK